MSALMKIINRLFHPLAHHKDLWQGTSKRGTARERMMAGRDLALGRKARGCRGAQGLAGSCCCQPRIDKAGGELAHGISLQIIWDEVDLYSFVIPQITECYCSVLLPAVIIIGICCVFQAQGSAY